MHAFLARNEAWATVQMGEKENNLMPASDIVGDTIEKENTPLLPANISIMFLQPVYCQDKRNVQGNKQMQLQ